jgi:23S rRNA-/tRNA-specific pseudouridylate synthase
VHLADSGFAIVGDRSYGGKSAKRVMLHAKKIELLGYSFEAPTPKDFKVF